MCDSCIDGLRLMYGMSKILYYHDGHGVSARVERPIGGGRSNESVLAGQRRGNCGPTVGRAQADVRRESRDEHGPPVRLLRVLGDGRVGAHEALFEALGCGERARGRQRGVGTGSAQAEKWHSLEGRCAGGRARQAAAVRAD